MEKLSINFYGEKIEVDFPNTLSDLYQKIMDNFFPSEKDVKELIITYTQDNDERFIETKEDFQLFIEAKVHIIDININQRSDLYKKSLIKVQKENEDIINQVNNIDKTKEEKIEKANNEIEIINKKIKELEIQKKELIQKIDKEITSHQNQIKLIKKNTQKEIKLLEEEKNKLVDNIGVKLGFKSKIKQNNKKENKKENKIKNEKIIIPITNQIKEKEIKKDEIEEKEEENNEDEYQCDICEISPIKGKRFHCQICENFDLCEKCYSPNEKLHFNGNHTFIRFIKKSQKKNFI